MDQFILSTSSTKGEAIGGKDCLKINKRLSHNIKYPRIIQNEAKKYNLGLGQT